MLSDYCRIRKGYILTLGVNSNILLTYLKTDLFIVIVLFTVAYHAFS